MPLDVVYLNHVAVPSGAERALTRLLPALTDVRAHVILAEDGWLAGELRESGISVEVLELPNRTRTLSRSHVGPSLPFAAIADTAGYSRTLAGRLRELRPALVHANSLKANVYGHLAARLAGVPSVWHARDRLVPEYLPAAGLPALRQYARSVPAGLISVSASTRASVLGDRPAGPHQPVIHDPLPAGAGTRPRVTDGGRFVVAMTGRIAEWKGQDVFLRAFAQAFSGDPAAEAWILGESLFGETDYADSLRSLADELGIAEQVTFTGHVDDVWAELARVDVVVHASRIPEPFGQVVTEAMAAGCAVVCAAAGGPLETVRDEVTGLHARPGDVADYARAMRRLRDDPDFARALAAAGRRDATARFAPGVIADQMMAAYDAALASAAASRARAALSSRRASARGVVTADGEPAVAPALTRLAP